MTNSECSGSAASQPEEFQRETQEKFAELSRNLSASFDALRKSLEEKIDKLTSSEKFIASVELLDRGCERRRGSETPLQWSTCSELDGTRKVASGLPHRTYSTEVHKTRRSGYRPNR